MKKILLFMLMLICMFLSVMFSVNATIEDNFNRNDNSTLGTATNGNTWSQTATTWSINNNTLSGSGTAADGTAQLLLSSSNPTRIDYEFYIGNSTTDAYYQKFGDNSGIGVGNYGIFLSIVSGNIKYYSASWTDFSTPITPSINIWYNVSLRNINYVADTFDIYWDGVLKGSGSFSANVGITHAEFDRRVETGRIDCLTTNGSSCIVTPTTPTITSDLQTYYNTSNITINLNTSPVGNTNMSYVLDSGNETFVCSDCNSTQINITGLSEGLHEYIFISTDENGQVNTSQNSTNDFTEPTIQKLTNISESSFAINFSTIFNVTDALSGLASCTINITELSNVTTPDNFFINCTDTETFNTAGLHNLFLTATDNAGNTNSFEENFTINPIVSVFFQNTSFELISNYNATIYHPDNRTTTPTINADNSINLSPVNEGELDLGVHTIQFEKIGFITQNFTLNITESSGGTNVTFNASDARIVLRIKDKVTGDLITGVNFTVGFVATVGLTTTTNTGIVNITNTFFLSENYRVLVSNAGYVSESIFFTFTNQELLELDIFMLDLNESNLGIVFIKAVDQFSKPIEGATVQALQWDSNISDYVKVSESLTAKDGLGTLNIIKNDAIYQFSAQFGGLITITNDGDGVIDDTENGKIITIAISPGIEEQSYSLQDLVYLVNESFNNVSNVSTITVTWQDLNGLPRQICINEYRVISTTETLVNENCGISDDAGTLVQAYFINNSFTTILKAEVKEGSQFLSPDLDSFLFQPADHPSKIFEDIGIFIFIMPFLFLLSTAAGIYLESTFIGSLLLTASGIASLLIAPSLINTGIVAFFGFLGWLAINYGVKPR